MKRNISIQLKAAFLFLVFAMNTLVGLACAVGLDMRFNTSHHDEEQAIKAPIHVHADGKKHEHPEPVKPAIHIHADGNKHEHSNEAVTPHHEDKKAPEKEGCCTDELVKLQNVEKNLAPKISIDAPAFVAILPTFLAAYLLNITRAFPSKKIVRFFYPPPPDILISIQKFQV